MADLLERLQAALTDLYRIEREIGSGGMATVFLAEDLKHHRRVALKVLDPELARAIGPERFLREIEITGRLTHPHILPLYDSGEAGGFLYHTMPYVAGESLRGRLEREKQLPIEDALRIAREVADALDCAHRNEIVHRDLKPENILLEEGHAVVADFGIAKAVGAAGGEKLTASGVAIGTPAYMSPEQAMGGGTLDGRSDLYSLGCVLYEMLAGQPPFTGPTAQSVVHQQMNAPTPDVRQLRPSVPGELPGVLDRALAKTAADRYATAAAFRTALETLRGDATRVEASATARGDAHRIPWTARWRTAVAVGALAVLVAVSAWWIWRLTHPPAPPEPTRIAILPFSVHGREDLAYLGDGMVTLLTSVLDGMGDVRCVDGNALLKWVRREKVGEIDATIADAAAVQFGAAMFVVGDIVEVGPKLRLQAALYACHSPPDLVARVRVEGHADSLTRLVDDLVRELIAEGLPVLKNERIVSVAARTTSSVPALRAFLEGERERRRGTMKNAYEAFERATELDTTFAIGWYRYGVLFSTEGSGRAAALSQQLAILDRAAGHANRLAERERQLVMAFRSGQRGDLDDAERRWRAVLARHPGDIEALEHLCALFGRNAARGRSPVEVEDVCRQASVLDPENGTAVQRLINLAALERQWDRVDSLAQTFLTRVPAGDEALLIRAQRAFLLDAAELDSLVKAIDPASPQRGLLEAAVGAGATFSERLEEAVGWWEAMGRDYRAGVFRLAIGRLRSSVLRSSESRYGGPLLLCARPYSNISRAALDSTRTWLKHVPVSDGAEFLPAGDRISTFYRAYLLGLLSARLGEYDRALEHAAWLDKHPETSDFGSIQDLAASIRATVMLLQGRAREGLTILEAAWAQSAWVYERYLRAELLFAVGDNAEALRWFSTVPYGGQAVIYLAPCHLRQAQIHERLGNSDEAIQHYQRFVELWKDCDPELRPQVEEARVRLAALLAARG